MNPDQLKKLEDEVKATLDRWDDLRRAIAYAYLYRSGLRISDAERLIEKSRRGDSKGRERGG